ncbi:MAG: hypothetical protein OER04_19630 [Cyclobacteriaceae bacterium]|nr:hypothetical protein [Cyclobacteriaceae bacterium]
MLLEKLVCLCYAVAYSDDRIHPQELDAVKVAMKTFCKKADRPYEPDKLNKVWKRLQVNNSSAADAFKEFTQYYQQHELEISQQLKPEMAKLAATIAASFAGNNKSELTLLSQLYFLMHKE